MNNGIFIDYSIVVPVFNEEDSLKPLVSMIEDAFKRNKLGYYEIIFIDDGSTDKSKDIIREMIQEKTNIKLIELRRNFGKAIALNEGFKLAKGRIVITMDADLQDDPFEIPKLLEMLGKGNDLVSGWKENRQDPLEKRLPSKLFNKMTGYFTGLDLHDFNCGFKAYRREVVENLELYGEMHRYVPALAHWKGFKVGEIAVKHHPRKFGVSKYGFKRYFRGLFDFMTVVFLTRYNQKPMHFFGKFGMILSFAGSLICLYLTTLWLMGETIGNRPLLNLGVLLIILGVQFFSTGLISEMQINLYREKEEKRFVVREVYLNSNLKNDRDEVAATIER